MIGPILILIGLFWLWIVFKGKSGDMWNAITGNEKFSVTLDDLNSALNPYIKDQSGGGNKSPAPVSGNTSDSGTHMGIGPDGSIVTINKDYGSMSNEEKDWANAYAHQLGNG